MKNIVYIAVATIGCAWACSAQTGFFSVEKDADGRWWGIRPDGRRFIPAAVVHVNVTPRHASPLKDSPYPAIALAKCGGEAGWATNVLDRLESWGFNIVDCDSDFEILRKDGLLERRGFGCSVALYMHRPMLERGRSDPDYFITPAGPSCGLFFPNVFHPEFEKLCDDFARKNVAPRRNERDIFGYYIANELAWWGRSDIESDTGLVDYVRTKLPPTHSARRAYDAFVADRGLDPAAESTRKAFFEILADRYFKVQCAAIRKYDPNHLILGCRFAGINPPIAMKAAAKHCDVVSVNMYAWADLARNQLFARHRPFVKLFSDLAAEGGKPFFISEWSFVSNDRGHGCRFGAGERFRSQKERAAAIELFLRTIYAMPCMVGSSYFRYFDSVRRGVSTATAYVEDCAYGLIDENDEPYPEVTETFARINRNLEKIRLGPLPEPRVGVENGKLSAAEFRAKMNWTRDGAASFSRDGESYRVVNDDGLVVSGRVGQGSVVESAEIGGEKMASVHVAMECGSTWNNATQVESVGWIPGESSFTASVSRVISSESAFRMTCKVTVPRRGREFMVEMMDVTNVGTVNLDIVSLYVCVYAAFDAKPDWSVGLPQSYGALQEAGWIGKDGLKKVRGWTLSDAIDIFSYTVGGNGAQHPDAAFRPFLGKFVLKPGETQVFDPSSVYVAICLSK